MIKIKDLHKKVDLLQPQSITTGSLNNISQKPSFDRRNSTFAAEHRPSIVPAGYNTNLKYLNRKFSITNVQNDLQFSNKLEPSSISTLENRIENLENKIEQLIRMLNSKLDNCL